MLNSDSNLSVINNELIKQAYLFVAQKLFSESGIKKKGSDSRSIVELSNKTTNLLLIYVSCIIYQNKHKSSDLSGFDKLLKQMKLISLFNYKDFNLSSEDLTKLKKILVFWSDLKVEDIGYIYDEVHKFNLKASRKTLQIEISSNDKKKKGSFYTPSYIVDYIIDKTLGVLLSKLAKKAKSESELISFIQNLKILDPSVGGGIFLVRTVVYLRSWLLFNIKVIGEKRISTIVDSFISNCLYGNDINQVACDITKISLLLMLSNKTCKYSIRNINCVNSLDLLLNEDQCTEDQSKGFKSFDVIISNPPFQYGENNPTTNSDTCKRFNYFKGQYDVYWLFYELAFRKLLKNGGFHGYIIPDAILIRDGASVLRENLLKKKINQLWHVGAVFEQLHVSSVVMIWQNIGATRSHKIEIKNEKSEKWKVHQQDFKTYEGSKFLIYLSSDKLRNIISKLQSNTSSIGEFSVIHRGEELGKRALKSDGSKKIGVLTGKEILPYKILPPKLSLSDKAKLLKKGLYYGTKILIRKTGADLVVGLSKNRHCFLQSVYCLKLKKDINGKKKDDLYLALLGFLNSKLINFYIFNTFTAYKLIYPQLNQTTILQIPLPSDFITRDWSELITLVQKRIKSRSSNNKTIEADIDEIVYSAYNLDQDEITLVNKHQTSITFKR